jgi:glycolate oxidase iron-sulfur subunit
MHTLAAEYRPLLPPAGTAAVLEGCVMPITMGRVNQSTVDVLLDAGWRVVVPQGQTCCGALHAHRGLDDQARALARQTIAAFLAAGPDVIVVNSAGCGAAMKEYGHLLADDPEWAVRAADFSSRVRDVSEFLTAIGYRPRARVSGRVTYQESCHLGHAQRVKQPPRQLLRAAAGDNYVEMAEADVCCGSGGIYTVLHPEMSRELLERTLDHIEASGASTVASSNPGCLMQIEAGVRARGLDVAVKHLVEVLDPGDVSAPR